VINGDTIETGVTEAAAVSPAVALQLSVDPCARTFTVRDGRISGGALTQFARLLSGGSAAMGAVSEPQLSLVLGRLSNSSLEQKFFQPFDGRPSASDGISLLSVDALDALLSDGGVAIDSEGALLSTLLRLGSDFFPLFRHVRWNFLNPEELVSALSEHAGIAPSESLWRELRYGLRRFFAPPRPGFDSVIVSELPEFCTEFSNHGFRLLWRGGRGGFDSRTFHERCDGHTNTLTLILDTDGNIFGGFTPVKWKSPRGDPEERADPSRKSFLFTVKNPHNFPPRKFGLTAKKRDRAIVCDRSWGPHFGDIGVSGLCSAKPDSFADSFGRFYGNTTGLKGQSFFTGSANFVVREIEVFEIAELRRSSAP
jgi:hypothetical protein